MEKDRSRSWPKHLASGLPYSVDAHDQQANDAALRDGSRLLSAYTLDDGTRVWVITEGDRSSTCVLLPAEY